MIRCDVVEINVENRTKKMAKKYLKKWEKEFPWLRYDNAIGKMFCIVCEEAKEKGHKVSVQNNFVKPKGNDNFRITTLKRHEDGSSAARHPGGSEHKRLAALLKMYPVRDPLGVAQERHQQAEYLRNIPGVYTAFHTVYHLAAHERPLSAYADDVRYV